MLPKEMKAIIMSQNNKEDCKQCYFRENESVIKSPNKMTRIMLHELLSNFDDDESNESKNSDDANEEASDGESDTTLLVNTVSPADIRKLLSIPSKKRPLKRNQRRRRHQLMKQKVKEIRTLQKKLLQIGKPTV